VKGSDAGRVLPSTSIAAHAVDELIEAIETEDRSENGVMDNKANSSYMLPPPPPSIDLNVYRQVKIVVVLFAFQVAIIIVVILLSLLVEFVAIVFSCACLVAGIFYFYLFVHLFELATPVKK